MYALLVLVARGMIDKDARPIIAIKQAKADPPESAPSLKRAATSPAQASTSSIVALIAAAQAPPTSALNMGENGPVASIGVAREFIDWYCKKFGYGRPDLTYKSSAGSRPATQWHAILSVNKKSVGLGTGASKKSATENSYRDASNWLAQCDPALWQQYLKSQDETKAAVTKSDLIARSFPKADFTPSLDMDFSDRLDERLRDIVWDMRSSELYKKAVLLIADQEQKVKEVRKARATAKANANTEGVTTAPIETIADVAASATYQRDVSSKSSQLRARLTEYCGDARHQHMRDTRAALPVYGHSAEFLRAVEDNPVVVLMAETGSGKTTQMPQIILDDWIQKGKGGECNIVCTQPRRIAAISIAQRVASERGEQVGESVGYQVRFDSRLPDRDGSILFCTTGIFLKRYHLGSTSDPSKRSFVDDLTHVIVDEGKLRDVHNNKYG